MLSHEFVQSYKDRPIKWGFPSGPNSLGEITYRRTYSRNGERWHETVDRVVRGTFEILEGHCKHYNLPFDYETARSEAQEMYDRIFNFKFLPPGRGLWMMGTDYIRTRGSSAPLFNCAFVSTEGIDKEFDKPFRFLMDVSMLGVGCGFDTRGTNKLRWLPGEQAIDYQIPDSREGWVDSTGALIRWGMGLGPRPRFSYGLIRPRGTLIRGFGGVCEGPESLQKLHEELTQLILRNKGLPIGVRDIVDIMNLIGKCVVAGNVRRTAEISFGDPDDEIFLNLKNYQANPERAEYGWTSNNSVFARLGMDYSRIGRLIADNGEPGLAWLENMQRFSRMAFPPDNKDWRARGGNPCLEQTLEHMELCCLVESFPEHHSSFDDFKRTLKYSYLYAKAVTLPPTHWVETNAVQLRNRRIGTSLSGVAQFVARRGVNELMEWCKKGYDVLSHYDRVYSEWLCVRESIKKSSVKPSGTVSLLAGATPGCHYPTRRCYIRRIRFAKDHPDVAAICAAGYPAEPAKSDPNTIVIEFPVKGDADVPTEQEVSAGDKMWIAAQLQAWWADNQVSCTVTFDPEKEGRLIPDLLRAYETKLKGISFLPMKPEGAYAQMPYESITEAEYQKRIKDLKRIEWTVASAHDHDDKYCDGDACLVKML